MSFDAFTAIATLVQAGAQIGTGVAARDATKAQARESRRRGAIAAEDERRKGRRLAGAQRAGFAKGGVRIDTGTPLDVLAQTAADSELNALRAAFAFEQDAENFESAGRTAFTKGIFGAGTTILGRAETFRDVAAELRNRGSGASVPVSAGGSTRGGSLTRSFRIPGP